MSMLGNEIIYNMVALICFPILPISIGYYPVWRTNRQNKRADAYNTRLNSTD